MADFYSSVYKSLIIAGIIAFIIGFFTAGTTSYAAYISGYSVLILGILMILTMSFNKIISNTKSTFENLYAALSITGPFILMLAIISFIMYLMITYKDNIISQRVSTGYYSFSNIAIILMLLQLYFVYTSITTKKYEDNNRISKVTTGFLYLLGVLQGICSINLFIILKYFTTDGFQNM